jgi:hypothetical protein
MKLEEYIADRLPDLSDCGRALRTGLADTVILCQVAEEILDAYRPIASAVLEQHEAEPLACEAAMDTGERPSCRTMGEMADLPRDADYEIARALLGILGLAPGVVVSAEAVQVPTRRGDKRRSLGLPEGVIVAAGARELPDGQHDPLFVWVAEDDLALLAVPVVVAWAEGSGHIGAVYLYLTVGETDLEDEDDGEPEEEPEEGDEGEEFEDDGEPEEEPEEEPEPAPAPAPVPAPARTPAPGSRTGKPPKSGR